MNCVVFVNGTFDVLHSGHLNLLDYAKGLGGILLIAIDSDERVTRLKGAERPINDVAFRRRMLKALYPGAEIKVFSSDNGLVNLIEQANSLAFIYDKELIMVKGSDYRGKPIIGSEYFKRIDFVEHNGKSTTSIVGR